MVTYSKSYLLKSDKIEDIAGIFSKKKKGLLVTRETPKSLNLKKVDVVWITNIKTEVPHFLPHQLEQISYDIEKFMKSNTGCHVVLSGIEYLISYTSFKKIFHMIHDLKDLTYVTGNIFVVSIGKNTMDKQEENLLGQELVELGETHG